MNIILSFPSPYGFKKICIVVIALSIFIGYLNLRMKNKCRNFRQEYYNNYDPTVRNLGGPNQLQQICFNNGPIIVSFTAGNNFETVAEALKNSYLNFNNLCRLNYINICKTDNCEIMDLRLLLHEYFIEITELSIFEKRSFEYNYNNGESLRYKRNLEPFYFLKRDSELKIDGSIEIKTQNRLKALGFMLGIAIATESYIEMNFAPFFHCKDDEQSLTKNLEYLDLIDPDQYSIYKEIMSYNFQFEIVPKSLKPFLISSKEYFRDGFFYQKNLLTQAAQALFITPYSLSRDFINQGIQLILRDVYYNFYVDTHYYYDFTSFNVNFDAIFYDSYPKSSFFCHNWKDHSDYDRSTRIFWKALLKFSERDQSTVYKLVTGFNNVPYGGFKRLPRTKIIIGNNGIFGRKFEIQLNEFSTVKSIKEEIDFYLNEFYKEKNL